MAENDATTRRESIRGLIRSRVISTQEELVQLLGEQGFEVTQATLSRDLARLGARRVPRVEGGAVYELPDVTPGLGAQGLAQVHHLVTTVDDSDAMVVVRTLPGGASAVAAAIDSGRPAGVLASLAGDDTIFIVPTRGTRPARVAKDLRTVWKKGIQQ